MVGHGTYISEPGTCRARAACLLCGRRRRRSRRARAPRDGGGRPSLIRTPACHGYTGGAARYLHFAIRAARAAPVCACAQGSALSSRASAHPWPYFERAMYVRVAARVAGSQWAVGPRGGGRGCLLGGGAAVRPRCFAVAYCNEECRRNDWPRHRFWCGILRGQVRPHRGWRLYPLEN